MRQTQTIISILSVVIALCVGSVCGIMWEQRSYTADASRGVSSSNAEAMRWVVLSERIDSVSSMAEHDFYVLEDRFGRIEERMLLLETQ